MKITKEQLDSLIRECVDEKMDDLLGEDQSNFGQPGPEEHVEMIHRDIHDAMTALRNASEGLKSAGRNPSVIDDCFFRLKRFIGTELK